MTTRTNPLGVLPPADRERLMELATEVSFPAGTRTFEESSRADRFWIIHTGSVTLDVHVPGRRATIVDTIGHGDYSADHG